MQCLLECDIPSEAHPMRGHVHCTLLHLNGLTETLQTGSVCPYTIYTTNKVMDVRTYVQTNSIYKNTIIME